MNPRERLIILSVGTILVCFAGWYAFSGIFGAFESRQQRIARLQSDISKQEAKLRIAQRAQRRRRVYEEIALPGRKDRAAQQYQALLLGWMEQTGFANVKLTPTASGNDRITTHKQLTFNIYGQGNLEQLVRLLHLFYSRDCLHRIRQLKIQPVTSSKNLTINMMIDALSMPGAEDTEEIVARQSDWLKHGELTEYLKVIGDRNLFAAGNHAPKLATIGTQTAYPNRPLSFSIRATDADALDQLTYRMENDTKLASAKLDPKTGMFQWSPVDKGEFEFTVSVSDNGIPARSDSQVVRISVTDPPPEPVKAKPKLEFDHAKYTKLTAVVQERDDRKASPTVRHQAWLMIQPTGETVQLYLGDAFAIGSINGKIVEITTGSLTFDTDTKRHTVQLGQSLLEGSEKLLEQKVAADKKPSDTEGASPEASSQPESTTASAPAPRD
ncbi:MAG: cadherin repeat domain-containing protein [Planctomycetes bacterium]|nr:cadherin repeat domain-containing protein [Planctomycetota bacterium]